MMKDRAQVMKRYDYLKLQHRCTKCGERDERTVAGKTLCAKCYKKQKSYYSQIGESRKKDTKTYNTERYYRLVSLGLCVCCGKESVSNNNRRCPACRAKYSKFNKKYYEKKKKGRAANESKKETA